MVAAGQRLGRRGMFLGYWRKTLDSELAAWYVLVTSPTLTCAFGAALEAGPSGCHAVDGHVV